MGKFSVNSIRGNENGKVRLGEGLLNDASKDIVKMRIVNLERDKIRKTQAITIALMTLIHLPNQ